MTWILQQYISPLPTHCGAVQSSYTLHCITLTFWAENWHTAYSCHWQQFWVFCASSFFETDGKTCIAACWDGHTITLTLVTATRCCHHSRALPLKEFTWYLAASDDWVAHRRRLQLVPWVHMQAATQPHSPSLLYYYWAWKPIVISPSHGVSTWEADY